MEDAYGGAARHRRLDTRKGGQVVGLEDISDRLGKRPEKRDVVDLAPADGGLLMRLISAVPAGRRERVIWGYLTGLAAERMGVVTVPPGDFAGLEMESGRLIICSQTISSEAWRSQGRSQSSHTPSGHIPSSQPSHVGERMAGGRIQISSAGDYLGQEMHGGGITAISCVDYAFRNMKGGWGVVMAEGGNYAGVGNSGGRILFRGSVGSRAGWLMRAGRLVIAGDAGEYLGLGMRGGEIIVRGCTGARAGQEKKGGTITVSGYGPEAGDVVVRGGL